MVHERIVILIIFHQSLLNKSLNNQNQSNIKEKLLVIPSLSAEHDSWLELQGVSQYFSHLGFCNFLASRALRVQTFDIFVEPSNFNFKTVLILNPSVKIDQISTLRRKKWKLKTNIFLHKNSSLEYVKKS